MDSKKRIYMKIQGTIDDLRFCEARRDELIKELKSIKNDFKKIEDLVRNYGSNIWNFGRSK